ncbi:MAG TPA: beta-1,6-N-acetylglucosaminyltransferase [Terrimicrobiaceae bacterium]
MKHAFLIIAYKHVSLLTQLIEQLDHPDSSFFIHIDKKSPLIEDPSAQALKSRSNVYFAKERIDMHWAGFSHVRATLQLLESALSGTDATYCHLLSGQCFPIRSMVTFLQFFEENNGRNFMDYFSIPDPRWGESGGRDRLTYYHLHDVLNSKGRYFDLLDRKFTSVQKLLNIKRRYPKSFPSLYGGGTWWSLHRDFLEYFLSYIEENPVFYKRFQHSFCPDEFLFQTVLMDSPFKDTAVNNNLRFIDWSGKGSSPPDLDETYLEQLMTGEHLFARKFDPLRSERLIQRIKAEMLESSIGGARSSGVLLG